MEIYLVGGAVRDRLLGKAVQDRDWVVVGATPDEMLAQGFKQVGADFPVFLHPGSREEYALARTERKQGRGYHGFTVYSAPDVTLEDDLRRRDLTVNAMAQAEDGTLIDPFDGQRDLERRLLRHVSPAFSEDPLRILRVARFAARLAPLGFEVAEETLTLMTDMVASGEADHLVPERTWQETRRALHEQSPRVYFEVLRRCGALAVIIPELDRLFDGLQPLANEADDGELALRALTRASALSDETCVRFAALTHALGPESGLSEAAANRKKSRTPIQALCERLKVPNDCRDLALAASAHHAVADQALSLEPTAVLQLLDNLDAWRRPQRFEQFLLACEAIAQARIPPGSADFQSAYPQADSLRDALRAAQTVEAREFLDRGVTGKALGKAIREARLQRIEDRLRGQAPP